MAHDFARHLNPIQRERAERAGITEDSAAVDRQRMILAGELPSGLNKHTVTKWQDAEFNYLSWYDAATASWKWERVNKESGEVVTLSAPTVQQLQLKYAEQQYDEMLDSQDSAVAYRRWCKESRWGRMFYEIDCAGARRLVLEQLAENGDDTVTFESLERAWLALYDDQPSPLDIYLDAIQQPQEQPQFRPVGNPSANLAGNVDQNLRRQQDAENRKLSTEELRRRALFGSDRNAGRTISTGTKIVPRQ